MDSTPEAAYVITAEAQAAIDRNKAELAERTAKWLESAEREQISVTAEDGAVMKADLIREGSHDWALIMHGYIRTRERTYNYARFYAERGYSVVLPDMRGHGGSGGSFVGMGWLDRLDVKKWTELIVSLDPEAEIVLHGVSMGGLPDNVKCVVADCGYTSVWDEFGSVMQSYTGLPEFPLLHTTSLAAKLIAGYSFDEASALEQVKKSGLPILFIHGSRDTFVPARMAEELYAAHPNGELYIADGAAHGQAMYIDPEAYFTKVFGFTGKYITEG